MYVGPYAARLPHREAHPFNVIPSVSRGILYRKQKPFRTRLYAWLPPEGPGARKQGSQKVSKNFLGRGAAGAAGKTASTARRLPWRLAGDEMRGYCPCYGRSRQNKDGATLIRHAQQAARATFPLKKGEGMKWESVCNRCACAQDFSTRSVAAAPSLGRNDKEGFLLRDPFDFAGTTVLPLLRSG